MSRSARAVALLLTLAWGAAWLAPCRQPYGDRAPAAKVPAHEGGATAHAAAHAQPGDATAHAGLRAPCACGCESLPDLPAPTASPQLGYAPRAKLPELETPRRIEPTAIARAEALPGHPRPLDPVPIPA